MDIWIKKKGQTDSGYMDKKYRKIKKEIYISSSV